MPDLARFARRFFLLRLLRVSLVLGALYDLVFAVLMVAAPQGLAERFDLPLPGAPFYLWLLALLLTMLAALYLIAARDPRRYSGIIGVAVAGRLAGAIVFAVAAAREPAWAGLWSAAAADAVFGLAHALLWRSIH
ncbi:MAG TPA: hypothetical protein VHQ65_02140 [Thermoanaerobaculia bacterium]|nr:hypothetical protein [Thermoanaerobaculia bacterium]